MRIIDDETVRAVLNIRDCIEAMQSAYEDLGRNVAVAHPRQRYKVGGDLKTPGYMANMIAGAVPSTGVAALRYDSTIVSDRLVGDKRRMEFHYPQRRSWGFVLLFSLTTGEPLACIQDFSLSSLRVGATTGVAFRALAKKNAKTLALYGSGNEARRNLEAICAVRPIEKVQLFSPNREHREAFAAEMTRKVGVSVQPMTSSAAAFEGADAVMCATNSSDPVFDGSKLKPGQLVCTIANTDHVHFRTEADEQTFLRSNLIVVNHYQTAVDNNQRELLDLIKDGRVPAKKVVELAKVLVGASPGRSSEDDIIYYKSNTGMGIQFAAACKVIYDACERQNLGHVVPTEWFGADIGSLLDQGYLPSP
jgi:alanine dehydrogenase